ncbi:MAG: HipA domain-containing protein [Clostridia bacterium]
MTVGIDFTDCKRIMGRAYNGANGKKIAVEYDGGQYMLKFPSSGKGKPTELFYTNSCISEHIASSIFSMLNIRAQQTLLGTYKVKGEYRVVCACRDFTADGKRLLDFCSIKNTIIDSEHGGTGTELTDVLESIEKQQFVPPDQLLEYFWNVFIVDALLGNFDRHNGNWGFLYDDTAQSAEIAPVYDCGSCLLPQADDQIMKNVIENEDELNARVYQFPTSAIKQNGKKINYYDFLTRGENADCNAALLRIVPGIKPQELTAFIDGVPYISNLQKDFYQRYIVARYEKILVPAYAAVLFRQQEELNRAAAHDRNDGMTLSM